MLCRLLAKSDPESNTKVAGKGAGKGAQWGAVAKQTTSHVSWLDQRTPIACLREAPSLQTCPISNEKRRCKLPKSAACLTDRRPCPAPHTNRAVPGPLRKWSTSSSTSCIGREGRARARRHRTARESASCVFHYNRRDLITLPNRSAATNTLWAMELHNPTCQCFAPGSARILACLLVYLLASGQALSSPAAMSCPTHLSPDREKHMFPMQYPCRKASCFCAPNPPRDHHRQGALP